MRIMNKLQQYDFAVVDNFKKSYLRSPQSALAERIQLSTFAVLAILLTVNHTRVSMIAIFLTVSLLLSGWCVYSWRTFRILRKEGKNLDEPIFIHGPVHPWRLFLFIPAALTLIVLIFSPGGFSKIIGYSASSSYRPADIIYPIAFAIVGVEFWRFFETIKECSPRRHLICVFLLTIAGIAFSLFIAPVHRPPAFIDFAVAGILPGAECFGSGCKPEPARETKKPKEVF